MLETTLPRKRNAGSEPVTSAGYPGNVTFERSFQLMRSEIGDTAQTPGGDDSRTSLETVSWVNSDATAISVQLVPVQR